MIVSCTCLQMKYHECSKSEEVGHAINVENIGSGFEDENEAAVSKREDRTKRHSM